MATSAAPVTRATPFEQPEHDDDAVIEVDVASDSDGSDTKETKNSGVDIQSDHRIRFIAAVKTARKRMTAGLVALSSLWLVQACALVAFAFMAISLPGLLPDPVQVSWLGWNVLYFTGNRGLAIDKRERSSFAQIAWLPYALSLTSLGMLAWRWSTIVWRDRYLAPRRCINRACAWACGIKLIHASLVVATGTWFTARLLHDTATSVNNDTFNKECEVQQILSEEPGLIGYRVVEGNRAEGCRQGLAYSLGDRPENSIKGSFEDVGTRTRPALMNGSTWLWSLPVGRLVGCPGELPSLSPTSFGTRDRNARRCLSPDGYTVSNWVTKGPTGGCQPSRWLTYYDALAVADGPTGGCQPSRWLTYYDALAVADAGHMEQWFCDQQLRHVPYGNSGGNDILTRDQPDHAVGSISHDSGVSEDWAGNGIGGASSIQSYVDYVTVGFPTRRHYPCYDPSRDPIVLAGLSEGTFWSEGGIVRIAVGDMDDTTRRALLGPNYGSYRELGECRVATVACSNVTWTMPLEEDAEARRGDQTTGINIAPVLASSVGISDVHWAIGFEDCSTPLGPVRKPAADLAQWQTYLTRFQRVSVVVLLVGIVEVLYGAGESLVAPLFC